MAMGNVAKFGGKQKESQHKRFKRSGYRRHFGGVLPIAVVAVIAGLGSIFLYTGDSSAQFVNTVFREITKIGSCKIKGNVSYNSGRKIYHIPGQQDYENTVISPRRGERWFCTEAEAKVSGWRKAGR